MLPFQKHPKLLNYTIQPDQNQRSISSLKPAEKTIRIDHIFKKDNNMMKRTRRLPAIASSAEAGGHLFLIGVAYKPDIIVKVLCHLID